MACYRYEPYTSSQREMLADTHFHLLNCGQGGSGKTHGGAAKAFLVGYYYANSCIALVRKKRTDLKDTLWKSFIDKVLDPQYVIKSNDSRLYRKLANGSEFYGIGLDSSGDVNKLASREYNLVVVEEATELTTEDYDEKITRTVRLPEAAFWQILSLCNPGSPTHFLYRRFYLHEVRNPKDYKLIESKTLPREYLPERWIDIMNNVTGIFYERYVVGRWVGAEGVVYPFDPKKHIQPIEYFLPIGRIPADWEKVVAMDFGFPLEHATCVQWWAITPDGKWLCYRQIYVTERRVEELAPLIAGYNVKDYITGQYVICDHDADGRATLNAHGIKTKPAFKNRIDGQQIVHKLISEDRVYFLENNLVEEDINLKIHNLPFSTEQEFGTYVWTNKEKQDMIKKRDHGMDTMRMAMATYYRAESIPKDTTEYAPTILQRQ